MPELGWELFSEQEKADLLAGMASGNSTLPPRTIQIDWTDRCNIDCFFCSQADMRKGGRELPLSVLEGCFTEMDELSARTLNVAGGGDPLFHREIVAILESIRSRAFRIGTVTTNAVLARAHVAELLVETTREQITISLNSLGGEDYARAMHTTARNYERVLDNVRLLVAEKNGRSGPSPRIALQFLVHDGTYRQLPQMLELAQELRVDRVAFNPLMFFDGQSRGLRRDVDAFLNDVACVLRNDTEGIVADVRTIYPDINDRIAALRRELAPNRYVISDRQKLNYDSLRSFCSLPWFNLHVKASGDVYPCCALLNPTFRPFGNVHRQTLREIWEDRPYRRFRQSHARFVEATRNEDEHGQKTSDLPKPCTVHGMCFLRALPYLDDTPFAVSVDALSRLHPQAVHAQFPDSMRDGEPAVVAGTDPGESAGSLEIFVNHLPCGRADRKEARFSFRFRPEPLSAGFHLLEVRDDSGRILAARMVEKIGRSC